MPDPKQKKNERRDERRPAAAPIEREHETTEGALEATDENEGLPSAPPLHPDDSGPQRH